MNFSTFKHPSAYLGDLSFRVLGFGLRIRDTRRGHRPYYAQRPQTWLFGIVGVCPHGYQLGHWHVRPLGPWS